MTVQEREPRARKVSWSELTRDQWSALEERMEADPGFQDVIRWLLLHDHAFMAAAFEAGRRIKKEIEAAAAQMQFETEERDMLQRSEERGAASPGLVSRRTYQE
jgi:hypothetical protein